MSEKTVVNSWNEWDPLKHVIVLLDDRKDGYGTKIKDSELIGIPLNIIIGKQFIEKEEIEFRTRTGDTSLSNISDSKTILDFFKNK